MMTRLGFAWAGAMNAPEQHSARAEPRANATVSILMPRLRAGQPSIRQAYGFGIIWQ